MASPLKPPDNATGEASTGRRWPGYFDSPWPGEDGGPARAQRPAGSAESTAGLDLRRGERLRAVRRHAFAATMLVLRQPGELYLLRHQLCRHYVGIPTSAWVERIDPESLEPLERSPMLPGGPFWPGGLAAHANGSLYVVYGRHCHRLSSDCQVTASRRLPRDRPYNSFVILADGCLVMKDIDRASCIPAGLVVLDPERLEPLGPELCLPEPCVARLSADGNTVYAVGDRHVFRCRWDGRAGRLDLDETWRVPYRNSDAQSHGWDPVIEGDFLWFMDNGRHTYSYHMLGAGVSPGPVHLVRAHLGRAEDCEAREISGLPRGTITNPPLTAPDRKLIVGYDSGNAVLAAWEYDAGGIGPLRWRRSGFACASHMIYFPRTGELCVNDFSRLSGEAAVVLDISTGDERGRVKTGSPVQSVVFPALGWKRDFYYVSFTTVTRVFVD